MRDEAAIRADLATLEVPLPEPCARLNEFHVNCPGCAVGRRAMADKAEARVRLVADVEPLLAALTLFTGTIKRVLDGAPPDADVIHIAITRSYAERLIKQVP